MIRAVRLAYIEKSTNFVERVYFAWLSVFVFRRWYVWIDRTYSSSKNDKFFITRPCYLSVEINAHTLVYLALLVIQGLAKEAVLRIYDFNSQTCENTFRIARSMSGTFSSVTNFSVYQFLQRAEKLSLLQSIRCDTNTQGLSGAHLSFPRHHKQQGNLSSPAIASHNGLSEALLIDTVLRAFDDATQLFSSFHPSDFRNALSIEELSCHIRVKLNRKKRTMKVRMSRSKKRSKETVATRRSMTTRLWTHCPTFRRKHLKACESTTQSIPVQRDRFSLSKLMEKRSSFTNRPRSGCCKKRKIFSLLIACNELKCNKTMLAGGYRLIGIEI